MSKKRDGRRSQDFVGRSDDQLPAAVLAAKNRVYALLYLGPLLIAIGFSWVPGMYNATYYVTVLLALSLAGALLWAVHKRAVDLVYTPFFVVLGLWLAAKLLTTVTSMLPYHSFWGTHENWSDGFVYALAVAVIAAVIVSLRPDQRRIIRMIHLFTAEAVVLAAATLGQAVAAGFFYQKVRPDSPIGNADFFISYSLLFLPVLLVLLVVYLRQRQWRRVVASGIGSLIMIMALFVSLPTHLQTILLPAFENGKVDTTVGATDTKAVTPGNFTATKANNERWTEWKFGLQFGMERPLVGTGPSTTTQAFHAAVARHSLDLRGWAGGAIMNHSHNDLIEQFSQEGIIGLAAYLAMWVVLVVIVVRRFRFIKPTLRPYAIGLGAGLILWFGFNQLIFTTVVSGVFVMVWVALLLVMVGSGRTVAGAWPSRGLGVIVLILGVAGVWVGRYWVDDTRIDMAISKMNQLSAQPSSGDVKDQWLQVGSLTAAAANDMPAEPRYNEMAAFAALDVYTAVEFSHPQERQAQAAKALHYAHKMLADGPTPEYLELLGLIRYVTSPIGSSEALSGLNDIDKAIALSPNWADLYANTASNAAAKKDYATARKYVDLGKAARLSPTDRQKFNSFAASLPLQ